MDIRKTTLVYAVDRELYNREKPYHVLSHCPDGGPSTNLEWRLGDTEEVLNIRGSDDRFTLDDHGFCFRQDTTQFSDWETPREVETQYLPSVEQLLKICVSGADEIKIFDWRVRRLMLLRSGLSADHGHFSGEPDLAAASLADS